VRPGPFLSHFHQFMVFAMLGFIAMLVFPALDHRFGWSAVPASVSVLGDALIVWGHDGNAINLVCAAAGTNQPPGLAQMGYAGDDAPALKGTSANVYST
jgi:hypothetical protein